MKAGDTFRFSERVKDDHLWMIISEPDRNPDAPLVIVSFTTFRLSNDPSCIVLPGDHPFLTRETCVYYRGARFAQRGTFDRCVACGDIIPEDPLSPEILARVREGAARSPYIREGIRKLLVEQGLIE